MAPVNNSAPPSIVLPPRSSILAPVKPASMRLANSLPREPGFVWDYTIVSQPVLNIKFAASATNKVGFAAAGETTNDVWNVYSSPGSTSFSVTNLLWSTGSASGAGVRVQTAPGTGTNTSITDNVFKTYITAGAGTNIIVTITNLATANYDVYVYLHGNASNMNGVVDFTSNGTDYGTQSTTTNSSFAYTSSYSSSYWEIGMQYVVFTNVSISSAHAVVLTLVTNGGGRELINGVQFVPTTSSCFNAPNGLVSWWQGEGNANDAVGVNNATLHGGVTHASGKVGSAFSFDGTSGYLSAPASASLNLGTNGTGLSIEGWIKPTDLSYWHPVMEWNNGTNAGVTFWLNPNAHTLELNIMDTNGLCHDFLGTTNMLTAGVMQHIAASYDGYSGALNFYSNGVVALATNVNYNWVLVPQTAHGVYPHNL